jgi:hypothetical protein
VHAYSPKSTDLRLPPRDLPADRFDATRDVVADDLEFWFEKPGDETEWQWRPAQQMPVACVRGCCLDSHQHVTITNVRKWELSRCSASGGPYVSRTMAFILFLVRPEPLRLPSTDRLSICVHGPHSPCAGTVVSSASHCFDRQAEGCITGRRPPHRQKIRREHQYPQRINEHCNPSLVTEESSTMRRAPAR